VNPPKSSFSFEVNLTEGCNWACEYCFEGKDKITGKQHLLNKNPDQLLKAIHAILNDDWFNRQFGNLHIDFWGGEPTLNLKLMSIIIREFMDDERVAFFLYTNGSRVEELIHVISCLKDKTCYAGEKLDIQVSYDGNPIHDLRRVDKKGNGTSHIARHGMSVFALNGFKFKLKSTLMPKDFKHMSEAWDDILALRNAYGNNINYAPTIEYYTNDFKEEYLQDLEKGLMDIAFKEYNFFIKERTFMLMWFTNNMGKAVCGSGKKMAAVDIDGNVYLCHGAIYNGVNSELKFGDIFDIDELLQGIKHNNEYLMSSVYDEECERCEATTCIRCNYAKYLFSKENDFIDKFYDMKCQNNLCQYYKLIGKISRGLMMNIQEVI